MNQKNIPSDKSDNFQEKIQQPFVKRKTKIRLVWLIIIFVIGTTAWYGYKLVNPEMAGPRIHPLSLTPPNALYVLETDRPYKLWSEISQTSIWSLLENDKEWKEHGQMMNELESTLSGFDQALDVLTNRKVYVSGHSYRSKESDLLFIVDLEGLGLLQSWMTSLEEVTKRTFKNKLIYEKLDIESKETLYFSFEDNYLIASYTHTLVEASINNKDAASLNRSFDFLDIRKKVLDEGLLRIYLNYESLYHHLGATLGQKEIQDLKLNLPFIYSGFYFDVATESLLLEGYSNYQDSLFTYLDLFASAGTGGTDISQVIPDNTSVYMSFGFDSFQEFFRSLAQQLSKDTVSGDSYREYSAKTEKYLGISIEEDLVEWIDDEIAVIQFELENASETALIMKAKSADMAKQKMDFLSHQIKRKTPVRFKTVDYRGHQINYMAVKGLFKLMLGKMFTKFDRPYFTLIEEYVIFADKPQVLRRIIDQKLEGKTLANVSSYQQFITQLGSEHSALLYVQLELLGNSVGGLIDSDMVSLLQSKSNLISHFPQFGLKISPSDKLLETKLLLSIEGLKGEEMFSHTTNFSSLDFDSLFVIDPGEQIIIEDIEIADLSAKKQSESYEEGKPKYEFEIKDGLKHGDYFEYHPTGELKIRGKYKSNLKEGTWKYYSTEGKLEKKEKYRKGVIVGN
ncbi:MAG: DUF3352 domain-containing protein [Reichenbachiella sp.]